ncbi:glycosyltransferase family 2 protein [Candidatus Daviesbacteria bacterium]|nr:glycosyltransferase family 2 protein [Candidatus Daviesbacteria bacterium]
MKIWANCIVHNEENFIWFAIMSVVDYVDKILVWDTGSTDKTVEIIEEIRKIKGDKIEFRKVGVVDRHEFTKMRQMMLDESKCDWILILDGDEIWWEDSIKQVVEAINKDKNIDAIVVPFFTMVGDVYHYQSEDAGKYELAGRKGHLTIRAINRRIPSLHLAGPYGKEGFMDKEERLIQDMSLEKLMFLDAPFLHLTHLKRSSKDGHNKSKYDLGIKFNKHFPEVFYLKRPAGIPSPWQERSKLYEILSLGKRILKS